MPRAPRRIVTGLPLHIVQRGHDRAECFRSDADRQMYLIALGRALQEAGCDLHAYVLMTNHVHLLVTPRAADSAPRLTISLGRRYARYFNDLHGRTGPLWEGRYRASVIDSDRYFLACSRYIEMNPVRAGMVGHPAEYAWSSYRANALRTDNPWLSPHSCYRALGPGEDARARAYALLFDDDLSSDTITRLRESIRHGIPVSSAIARRGRPRSAPAGPSHPLRK